MKMVSFEHLSSGWLAASMMLMLVLAQLLNVGTAHCSI